MKKGIEIIVQKEKRIVKGLGYYPVQPLNDLKELLKESVRKHGNATAFKYKNKVGDIVSKNYLEFNQDVDMLGTALLSLGLQGTKISIIGENRYEWAMAYYAIINGTGIAVPLDKYLPKNEVLNLIERGGVEAIFYSTAYQLIMKEIAAGDTTLRYFICMDGIDDQDTDARFMSLATLLESGKKRLGEGDVSFTGAIIDKEKLSILLFTSGTTALSKGVMLSHRNIACNVSSMASIIEVGRGDVHLSLLPLHHTFENTIGLSFMIHRGVCIAFCDGIKHIAKNLKEYDITLLVAVPAIFEAMYKKLREGIRKKGKERAFGAMRGVSNTLCKIGIDKRRRIFKSILAQIGPNLRLAVSGAAPIDKEIVEGFGDIGLHVIQGYGLTETSPVLAANNDFVNVPGSIGYPIGDVEMAIDNPDENGIGEILARGKNVMLGYYQNEAATKEAIDEDGWFHTGDLGTIDKKGIIRITGRAKSMIVLTNGKKAFPEEYETMLNNIPYVKDSFVWGNIAPDGDVQVCAQIVVDMEKMGEQFGRLLTDSELSDRIGRAIKEINKTLPQYKIIRHFVLTEEELTKTTTLKIKRQVEYGKIMDTLKRNGLDMRKASGKFLERV